MCYLRGVDEISPVQLWDSIMHKYKVAQICEIELQRLQNTEDRSKKEEVQRERVMVVAAAVVASGKLHHRESFQELRNFATTDNAWTSDPSVLPHTSSFMNTRDPLFWCSCFVRFLPVEIASRKLCKGGRLSVVIYGRRRF